MNQFHLESHFENKIKEAVNCKRSGQYDKAISIYQELFNLNKNVPQVHEGLAKVCAVSGRYSDAVECFKFASMLYMNIGEKKKSELCHGFSEFFTNPDVKDPDFKEVISALKG